ncbi:MAG: HAD family phosphatase [Chloroflexi bacterium]|nr:HAD family phosphatase [Chloroflexota bacterium]
MGRTESNRPVKRAVIFDYGGVLVRTMDYTPRHAWDDRLRLGRGSIERITHGSESWRLAQIGQLPLADHWADVARQLGLGEADATRFAADFYSGDQPDADLLAYIRELRGRGYPVGLLSNASPALRSELDMFGMTDLFDVIVPSCEIGVMKPDARAYHAVLERIQRTPGEAIFIDDRPDNVEGARAVGMQGIVYTAGMDLRAVLEPLLDSL